MSSREYVKHFVKQCMREYVRQWSCTLGSSLGSGVLCEVVVKQREVHEAAREAVDSV